MNDKRLFSIFLIVFIDLLGFSLILPLLPFFAEQFGANPTMVGLLVAVYAAAQFISAPLLGRLSDRIGRRPVLLISIVGNFIGFLMLGFAQSLTMLFAARLLAGFTAGNISVAQAYISDITDEKSRARGLGLIGAAFGLGFIVGPVIGGLLSKNGFSLPSFVAAGLSVLNFTLVSLWLPESLTAERRAALSQSGRLPFTLSAMLATLRRPVVGPLLHTRFIYGLAFSTFTSVFTLYAQYRFNLDAANTGYILAYIGVLSVLTQGLLIGRITARFSERGIILWATVVMTGGLLAWALSPSIALLLVVIAPIAASGGVLNTILNASVSKVVMPEEVGGILGVSSALESLTRVIAPSVGGWLLQKLGPSSPGIFASLLLAWLVTYIMRRVLVQRTPTAAIPVSSESA